MRILLVEDEKDLNETLVYRLEKENYIVDSCFNGKEALTYIEKSEYDLIIMDIMMPVMDGFQTLMNIRQRGNSTKVIFLTAKDELENRILGLDLGADDYLVKPFDFGELLARIRVHTRRQESLKSSFCLHGICVDINNKTVTSNGKHIELTAKEYEILAYLFQNQGRVISREQILDRVWDFEYDGLSNIVDVMIKNIRRKLAEYTEQTIINTRRGLGYVIQK